MKQPPMTPKAILAMEPGQELDELIAEYIMGMIWARVTGVPDGHAYLYEPDSQFVLNGMVTQDDNAPRGQNKAAWIPAYSTTWAEASRIAETWNHNWNLICDNGRCGNTDTEPVVYAKHYTLILSSPGMPMQGVTAQTGPLAICRAALLDKLVNYER